MTIDKKEISRLSPAERIKKLRQMEEERKKDVNEIEKMIMESMQEIKTDRLAGEIAPEQREVDISRLFEQNGGNDIGSAERKESKGAPSLKSYIAPQQAYQDYSDLKKFYGVVATGGALTEEQKAMVDEIGARVLVADKYQTAGEKAADILIASRSTLRKLKKDTGLG